MEEVPDLPTDDESLVGSIHQRARRHRPAAGGQVAVFGVKAKQMLGDSGSANLLVDPEARAVLHALEPQQGT